jgi:hypothetical protein
MISQGFRGFGFQLPPNYELLSGVVIKIPALS